MNLSESYKQRLKQLSGILKENEKSSYDLIVPKGHLLFHGTCEDFDIKDLRTGGYDEIFWTSDSPAISQCYIPVSGSKIFTSSNSIANPSRDSSIQSIQKQFGIEYSDFEFRNNQITSYRNAPIFNKIEDEHRDVWNKLYKKEEEKKSFENDMHSKWHKLNQAEKEEINAEYLRIKKEIEQIDLLYRETNAEKKKNQYVNSKLQELGYEPESKNDYNLDYSWKLKTGVSKDGKTQVFPADYFKTGRLFIIKPIEDLKIFDTTLGGTREGDLTDLEYHNLTLFRKIEEKGYDGIKIADFAQIEDEGNFGHHSIGLFKNTLKKLNIEEISATHPRDFHNNHYRKGDYETSEFKSWKLKNEN